MKFCTDCKDELLNAVVDQPQAGQHLMAIKMRMPYQSAPSLVLVDIDALSAKSAAALLSAHSSANTATTTAFVGLVNKLSAIALAVRSRSYELMAHCFSKAGALARSSASSRMSNLSIAFMGAPLVDGKVESPHRTAKASTRPLALLAAALAALTLTACGDCPPDAVTGSADTAIAAPSPAPVQTPAPEPVATPTPVPAPTPAPTEPEPITYCPQSTNVVCAPSPTPAPVRPVVLEPEPDYSYNDCRCDNQGVMTCSAPNPPAYVFCPVPPRLNPFACHYECNNESGPVSY